MNNLISSRKGEGPLGTAAKIFLTLLLIGVLIGIIIGWKSIYYAATHIGDKYILPDVTSANKTYSVNDLRISEGSMSKCSSAGERSYECANGVTFDVQLQNNDQQALLKLEAATYACDISDTPDADCKKIAKECISDLGYNNYNLGNNCPDIKHGENLWCGVYSLLDKKTYCIYPAGICDTAAGGACAGNSTSVTSQPKININYDKYLKVTIKLKEAQAR